MAEHLNYISPNTLDQLTVGRFLSSILVLLYTIVCSSFLVYYLKSFYFDDGFSVFFLKPVLCLGFFISSLLYFFRPRLALNGLLLFSFITMVASFFGQEVAGLIFHTIAFIIFSLGRKSFHTSETH